MKFGPFQFSPIKLYIENTKFKQNKLNCCRNVGTRTPVNKAKHTPFYFLTSEGEFTLVFPSRLF